MRLHAYCAGRKLVVEKCELKTLPCVFKARYAEHKDKDRFTDEYVSFLFATAKPRFARALSSRSADEVNAIIDEFRAATRSLIARDLDTSFTRWPTVFLVLTKKA